jgi:heme/copper-type cytochrome/quinol oxidase subunit 2
MLVDIFTLVMVLMIGGAIGICALLIFIYALWAMQENETDRSYQDAVRKNEGNPW